MPTLEKRLPRADRYSGNLISEAWALYDAGYLVGAVVTARVGLEKALRTLGQKMPNDRRGLIKEAQYLAERGLISRGWLKALGRLSEDLNGVAHGGHVDRRYAKELITKAQKLGSSLSTS